MLAFCNARLWANLSTRETFKNLDSIVNILETHFHSFKYFSISLKNMTNYHSKKKKENRPKFWISIVGATNQQKLISENRKMTFVLRLPGGYSYKNILFQDQ